MEIFLVQDFLPNIRPEFFQLVGDAVVQDEETEGLLPA
jgi:hypothetical protein